MAIIDRYFSRSDLRNIAEMCREAEENTSGEIRVAILNKRPKELRDGDIKDVAVNIFYQFGMDKTRDKTGVLLLILLNEMRFQILADEGINSKVGQNFWDEIASSLSESFKRGEYMNGLNSSIKRIGQILSENFPKKPDDRDELSNIVIVK